jgi:hypothetical protein
MTPFGVYLNRRCVNGDRTNNATDPDLSPIHRFLNASDCEREAYFARGTALADRKDRIRNWERRLHSSQN